MSEARSSTELNPWMFLHASGDVEVCKDSSFLAAWEITGIDADGSSSGEIEAMLNSLDMAYQHLSPHPVSLQWIVHRRKIYDYPSSDFPDAISSRIDDNRRGDFMSGENFINRHYLALVMAPNEGATRAMDRVRFFMSEGQPMLKAIGAAALTIFSDNHAFAYSKAELSHQAEYFSDLANSFTQFISGLGFTRLKKEELHGFLRRCINPTSGQEKVIVGAGLHFDDELIPDASMEESRGLLRFTGDTEAYAAGWSLKDVPGFTFQGAFDDVLASPFELTMSHSFKFASRQDAEKHISRVKNFNQIMMYPPQAYLFAAFRGGDMSSSTPNPARQEAVESAVDALGELSINRAFFGWHNFSLLVFAGSEQETEQAMTEMGSILRYRGLTPIRETLHLVSCFAATVPGMLSEVRRWHFIETKNLSEITPFLTLSSGDRENHYLTRETKKPCPALAVMQTEYRTPFYFNFHHGDLGHTFVLGPSGSGKSVGMNLLISQWRKYNPSQVYIFDKDYSCRIPTLLQGGSHVDMGVGKQNIHLNPLSLISDETTHQWIASWIEGLLLSRSGRDRLTSQESSEVWRAVEGVSRSEDPSMHRLRSIHSLLPPALKDELSPWVNRGPLSNYFDNETDSFELSDFSCIEIGQLMSNPIVAKPFMDYAFFRIMRQLERNRERTPVPTLIYIEECWFLLGDPFFAAKVMDWTKTLRKLCTVIVMATQSPEDLADSNIFASLRDNIPTRIFLPNRNAGSDSLKRLYSGQFGLNDDQIEDIRNAIPKRQYLVTQPGFARMVNMHIDPDSLACLRSDALAQSVFEKHYQSGHPAWKAKYIEEMSK